MHAAKKQFGDDPSSPLRLFQVSDGHFIQFFAPSNLSPLPKNIVFVIDVSGSMWGVKMKQVSAGCLHGWRFFLHFDPSNHPAHSSPPLLCKNAATVWSFCRMRLLIPHFSRRQWRPCRLFWMTWPSTITSASSTSTTMCVAGARSWSPAPLFRSQTPRDTSRTSNPTEVWHYSLRRLRNVWEPAEHKHLSVNDCILLIFDSRYQHQRGTDEGSSDAGEGVQSGAHRPSLRLHDHPGVWWRPHCG